MYKFSTHISALVYRNIVITSRVPPQKTIPDSSSIALRKSGEITTRNANFHIIKRILIMTENTQSNVIYLPNYMLVTIKGELRIARRIGTRWEFDLNCNVINEMLENGLIDPETAQGWADKTAQLQAS